MANSAINPTFLIDDIESIRNTITIAGHSFTPGDVLRYDVVSNSYQKALASGDTPQEAAINAEAIGIVESVTGNTITLVYKGEIDLSQITDSSGEFITEAVYYLTPENADIGRLTSIAPSEDFEIIKPMLVKSEGETGIVVNYIGIRIGGGDVVSLNSVQPIGTVAPYAGTSENLPTNWKLCNGDFLSTSDYGEYRDKIGTRYGWKGLITFSPSNATALITAFSEQQITSVFIKVGSDTIARCVTQPTNSSGVVTLEIRDWPSLSNSRDEAARSVPTAGSNFTIVKSDGQPLISGTFSLTTFSLTHTATPDLQSRFVVGSGIASERGFGVYNLADQGGLQEVILTVGEMPSHTHTTSNSGAHTHTITDPGHKHNYQTPRQINNGERDDNPQVDHTTVIKETESATTGISINSGGDHTHTLSAVGGSEAHQNLPPYMAMNWIIRVKSDGAASLNVSEIQIIQDLQIEDLIDIDALSPQAGQILVYDGTSSKYKLSNLFTGWTADSSLKIRESNGFVGAGTTLSHAVLTVANTTNQLAIVDTDSSGTTYGGHVLVSDNGLFHINNCNRPTSTGNTLSSSATPTLTIDAQNQGVGIRTGFGASVNGLFEVKGATNGNPLFNISSTGIAAFGQTAGSTGHILTVKSSDGSSILLKNQTSVSGSTIGSVVFGTETNSTTFGAAIFANYRGVSGSVSKISLALNVSDGITLSNALYIAETKNVGIGTQAPGYKLHVSGVSGSGVAYTAGTVTGILGADSTGGFIGTTSNHPLQFITNNTNRAVISSTGNFGINVANPDSTIHTVASSGTNRIRMRNAGGYTLDIEGGATFGRMISDGGAFSIYSGGAETLRLQTNKIGVDTVTLTEKFNVNGAARATNTPKGWADISVTGGINASVNTVSVSNPGTGQYIFTHNQNLTNYAVTVTVGSTGPVYANVFGKSANTFEVRVYNPTSGGIATSGLHSLSAVWYSI